MLHHHTTITVPEDLVSRAKKAGVNCSRVSRNAIEDATTRLEQMWEERRNNEGDSSASHR